MSEVYKEIIKNIISLCLSQHFYLPLTLYGLKKKIKKFKKDKVKPSVALLTIYISGIFATLLYCTINNNNNMIINNHTNLTFFLLMSDRCTTT